MEIRSQVKPWDVKIYVVSADVCMVCTTKRLALASKGEEVVDVAATSVFRSGALYICKDHLAELKTEANIG